MKSHWWIECAHALNATYKARGVEMLGEVVLQPRGMREFAIRDGNGYVLRFGTPG